MAPEELPEPVRAFLSQCVSSPEELGVLLALIDSDDRWWDAGALARQSHLQTVSARRVLDSLTSRNLLDIRISDEVRYRLRPGTGELQAGIAAVKDAYRRSPRSVWQWAAHIAGGTGGRKSGSDPIGTVAREF